ncbi:hypothetical protein ACPOL_0219 [Acidisarcina polymorpha]|uniref:Uncharacterized protein n=1 Tax=Acidisarcina polymorpha TaxID=2211140 RepID=A0A2Z5FT05_9BACT|nr:hypothetical protein ACPOL_0219 [Acidisarcina polymorpha]
MAAVGVNETSLAFKPKSLDRHTLALTRNSDDRAGLLQET